MASIKILKVKLLNGGQDGLEILYKESGLIQSKDSKETEDPVHPDLTATMNKFIPHLAILTDYIPLKNADNHKDLPKFHVTSYSLGSKEEGVTITGFRLCTIGNPVILNKYVRFEGEEESVYSRIDEVMEIISEMEDQTNQYLGGKTAPKPQLSIFDNDNGGSTPDHSDEEDNKPSVKAPRKKKDATAQPKPPAEDKELKPEEVEAAGRAKRGAKKSAAGKVPRKNHLGQELSNNSLGVTDEHRKAAKK